MPDTRVLETLVLTPEQIVHLYRLAQPAVLAHPGNAVAAVCLVKLSEAWSGCEGAGVDMDALADATPMQGAPAPFPPVLARRP